MFFIPTRFKKSKMSEKFPFLSRSATIAFAAASPMPLMAARPKRIEPALRSKGVSESADGLQLGSIIGVNIWRETFTSGPRTFMFMPSHASTNLEILSILPSSLESRAAINSTG